jgi:hypothetical protein
MCGVAVVVILNAYTNTRRIICILKRRFRRLSVRGEGVQPSGAGKVTGAAKVEGRRLAHSFTWPRYPNIDIEVRLRVAFLALSLCVHIHGEASTAHCT